jgi:hypothetical protein
VLVIVCLRFTLSTVYISLIACTLGIFQEKLLTNRSLSIRYNGERTIIMQQIGTDREKTDIAQGHNAQKGNGTASEGIFRPSSHGVRLLSGVSFRGCGE